MDNYYGSAAAAREAAHIWLFSEGSSKSPGRVFDIQLGYHFRVKANKQVMRFFFSAAGAKKRARR